MSQQARHGRTNGGPTTSEILAGPRGLSLAGVALCFVLSGAAALIYQTTWLRQFSLVFGTAELAVATVLAAYMAGLAAGAAAIEFWLPRIARPLLAYSRFELAIALTALAVSPLIAGLEWALVTAIGHRTEPPSSAGFGSSLFYMAGGLLALGLPTALMGATLPLLARHVVRGERDVGRRIGLLYAGNTAGAVAGALVAGFLLLPNFGLRATTWVGASINILVCLIAATLARGEPVRAPVGYDRLPANAPHAAYAEQLFTRGPHWILPLMLVSGAASFVYEVLWTRMLSHILGSSIFAFATMLASVLCGIALGGAAAALMARTSRRSARVFVLAQFCIAATAAAIYLTLDRWVPGEGGLHRHYALAILLLLPATCAIGATYPLAVRVLANSAASAPRAAARIYAWNTVGAVFGALIAGLALLPALRFEGTARLAVGVNLALALCTLLLVVRTRLPWLIAATVAVCAGLVAFQPQMPQRLLLASPLRLAANGSLRFYDVGRSATVLVLEQNGMFALRTNGLPEALIEMSGTPPKFSGEYWLAPIAALAAPRAASMLIVGLGGGSVVDGAPPSIQAIDVIELEPRVVAANRALAGERKRDPLADPRVTIILNDARSALALTDKRYDAIVSQPSHPWTAGASNLYTREFMQLARAHLASQGVFVQWMNIAFLDEALLRSFVATLLSVFPELEIYRPDPNTLLFVASSAPLDTAARLAQTNSPLAWSPGHYARFGILVPEDVVAALVVDHEAAHELARGAALITDDRNRLATSSVYDLGAGLSIAATGRLLAPFDPLRRPASWLSTGAAGRLSMPYIARRLALYARLDPALIDRVRALAMRITDRPTALEVDAIAHRASGDAPGAQALLAEAAELAPDNRQILFERLQPYLAALANNTAPADVKRLAEQLYGSAAAVVAADRYSVAGDWDKIAAIDGTLGLANLTDAWYFQALTARAEWRSRVANRELQATLGAQCMTLVDQAILSQPAIALFELRARCAAELGRADALIESLYAFTVGARANLNTLSRPEARALAQHLDTLAQVIHGAARSPAVEPARAEEVAALVSEVIAQLRARAGNEP
jgi:spermidine synthase